MSKNKYGGINDMESGWTKTPENKKVYMLWFDMLRRCYDDAQTRIICGAEESGMNIAEYAEYITGKADECRARLEGNP